MMINVYIPSASQQNNQSILDLMDEITGIVDRGNSKYLIFGGDLNCNLHKPSFVSDLLANFMAKYNLKFIDENSNPNQIFTFSSSRQQTSYIDFLLVSEPLLPEVVNFSVIDHALNLSDHLPIKISLDKECFKSTPQEKDGESKNANATKSLRWDHANLADYYNTTYRSLFPLYLKIKELYVSYTSPCACTLVQDINFLNSKHICSDCRAKISIEVEKMYNMLVSGLKCAADCAIPIMHQNVLKCWWTHEAQELKELAIESHRAWINVNKPKNGLIVTL